MLRSAPSRARRRAAAFVAVIALALLGIGVGAAPAQAATDVTGRLVDQLNQPVLGLEFIAQGPSGQIHAVTDSTGHFTIPALADGSYYLILGDNAVTASYLDAGNNRYENNGSVSFFVPSTTDLGDIVINKFVPISGTITNWALGMGDIRVTLYSDKSGTWQQVGNGGSYGGDTTSASFSFAAPISAYNYTLLFQFDGPGPYLEAFLGGELDDPSHATPWSGVAGVGRSGISMTMPDAALVTGRVTTGGSTPLEGILVSAQNEPDETQYDETTTDADGQYSLRVRPGVNNSLYAEDYPAERYLPMSWDNHSDSCGCTFDPVVSQLGAPAQNIDFDLVPDDSAPEVQGLVVDSPSSGPTAGIDVRLLRSVGGGWVLADEVTSTSSVPPNFDFTVGTLGTYRIQFADSSGHILSIVDGFTVPGLTSPVTLDPLPGCYADLGLLDASTALIAQVDPATPVGTCAPLVEPGTPGSGTTTTHHHHASTAVATAPFPTVTPTATPTPTASPSPSDEPSSPPVTPPHHAPAPAPNLWWLLWFGLAILILAIVGAVIFRIRRT